MKHMVEQIMLIEDSMLIVEHIRSRHSYSIGFHSRTNSGSYCVAVESKICFVVLQRTNSMDSGIC